MKPRKRVVWWFFLVSKILGLTFGLKLMERSEQNAQKGGDADLAPSAAEVAEVLEEAEEHEHSLLDMLHEQRLNYMGSIVLGLNFAFGIDISGEMICSYLHFPPSVISSRHEPRHDCTYQRQGSGLCCTG